MKACRLEPTDATPVWLMRQAGRYMKEYRDLRARVPFLDLCKDPGLVTELTVKAAKRLGVDAAIIFADLLLIAEPLGFKVEYDQGEGPSVRPALREPADYRQFVLPYTRMLIEGIAPGAPVIHFGVGTGMLLEAMREAGGHIIGLDCHVELDQAWARLDPGPGRPVGVQGNLDPTVLF